MKEAIYAIIARPRDILGVPNKRKCFNALVIGAEHSGKSQFLETFIQATAKIGQHAEEIKRNYSVIRSIHIKDLKVKDKNTTKYLQFTEIRDEAISSGQFEKEKVLHRRSDIIMLLFESNDPEQVNFVKETYNNIRLI